VNIQNLNSGFAYPFDFMDNLPAFPLQHAIPCSVLYNNEPRGGIFLLCPYNDLKFFGITPTNQPEPYLRFRMINLFQKAFAIEIHLGFEQDRILKVHLNPAVPQTIEFLKLCSETRMISFHYYNVSKNFFASSLTRLDEDHGNWFKRNYELAKNLPPTNDYVTVCQELIREMKLNQRLYHYFDKPGIDSFIREGSMVTKFEITSQSPPLDWQKKLWN
jgi:hypothetical protein